MTNALDFSDFGRFLAEARAAAGFSTQLDLATALEASQQSVSRWEAGRSRPRLLQIPKLAEALKIPPSALLEVAGYATPSTAPLTFVQPFPVDRLDPETFELFVEHLLQAMYGDSATVRRAGATGHKQDGLDIAVTFEDGRRHSYQCKRTQQFGPADVSKAVAAHTAEADAKHLVLSRVVSPQTADAVRRFDGWTLWDKDDISRLIRMKLSVDQQNKLVDIFFRGQRQALLGRSEPGPWLTVEDYFSPFAGPTSALSHDWELKGRDAELDALKSALKTSDKPLILVVGPGGIGKSRLLKEGLSAFAQSEKRTIIRILSPASDVTPTSLEDLGQSPKLLVVDDAHDRDGLAGLMHFAANPKNSARLVLATRSYARARVEREGATLGIQNSPTIELKHLTKKDTEELAKEVLAKFGAPPRLSERIVEAARDCPLVTVVAARILAQDKRPFERAKNDKSVRDLIMGKFSSVVIGDLGSPIDQEKIRAILDVLALVQPFHIEDPALFQLLQSLKGIGSADVSRLLRILVEGCVIYRRSNQYRLMPDLLADYLIEESCINAHGKLSPFALTAFETVQPPHLKNLLVNLGRLDWRLQDGNPTRSKLLDVVWRSFSDVSGPYDPRMDAIHSAAMFQAHHALTFVSDQVRKGLRYDRLATILRSVAYDFDLLDDVCSILWQIGRDDKRETNPHPGHPIRVLSELCGFEERKPLGYNQKVFEFVLKLTEAEDAWRHHYTPLDVLRPILALEGTTTRSHGRSISFTPFLVNYEAVLPLRTALVDRVLELLQDSSPRISRIAANTIQAALQETRGGASEAVTPALRAKYHREFRRTLNGLRQALESGRVGPVATVTVARAAAWQVNHGSKGVAKSAAEVLAALPTDTSFRLVAGLLGASDDVLTGKIYHDGWHERYEVWLTNLRDDLKNAYPQKKLYQEIDGALNLLTQAGEDRAASTTLLEELIRGDKVLAREFVANIHANPRGPIRSYLAIAISELLNSSPTEGQAAARSFLDHADLELRFEAVKAFGALRRAPAREDLEIFEIALRSENYAVVTIALRAILRNQALSKQQVIDLARKANIGDSEQLADAMLMLFSGPDDKALAQLSPDDVSHFLRRIAPIETLDGPWTQAFLSFVSFAFPHPFLDFAFERMDRAVSAESYTFRPLNYGPWMQKPLRLHESAEALDAFERIWNWVCDHPKRSDFFFKTNIGNLFEALFAGGFHKLAAFLGSKTATSPREELAQMGEVLQEAPRHFVFQERLFVVQLLERCNEFGADLVERVTSNLYGSAAYGMRSGTVGHPTNEDLQQRDKAKEALANISRLSPAYALYDDLLKSAEGAIAQAYQERVAMDDE